MRWQIQKNVFPHERRKINRLRAVQFGMNRKRRRLDVVNKFFETTNASQLDRLNKRAVRPERTFRNADVDLVFHRPEAVDSFRFQFRNEAIFFAFEVQALGGNLLQMDFHFLNFFPSALATMPGTNFETSPPSRAISFTNRELK